MPAVSRILYVQCLLQEAIVIAERRERSERSKANNRVLFEIP